MAVSRSLGQIAYETYRTLTRVSGVEFFKWEELGEEARRGWENVAQQVVSHQPEPPRAYPSFGGRSGEKGMTLWDYFFASSFGGLDFSLHKQTNETLISIAAEVADLAMEERAKRFGKES